MIPQQMRKLFILFLVFSFSFAFGQKIISKKYESTDLRDIRDVKIYLPKNYEKDTVSNFPLTIVLEEEKLFDLYVGVSSFYAAQDHAPEQIIVGVNVESSRSKDMGYDLANSNLNANARRFYTFLRDELLPFVEANYKTSPFLTIVGEGLSANFITYFLNESQPIFNAYISLNPTYAPDIRSKV
jgi:predicted alpha/beta superfamily hydrolase